MAPITIIPKACSCCKGERSSRDKSSNLPLPNILYEGSKGSEGGGGGFAASFIKKGRGWRRGLCRRVVKGKVLKMDGPSAPRVVVAAPAQFFMPPAAAKAENHTTGPGARWKCTPSACGISPGGAMLFS